MEAIEKNPAAARGLSRWTNAEHRACRHWLSSGATMGHATFCPNAALLDTLQGREQAASDLA